MCILVHAQTYQPEKKSYWWRSKQFEDKKQSFQADIDFLNASVDQLGEKAEKFCDISCIVQSIVMRKAAKGKMATITDVDKQLADKLLEQKSCE